MKNSAIKKMISLLLVVVMIGSMGIGDVALSAASKTVSVLNGDVSITDEKGTGSVSNGVVKITAKGSIASKTTNNITITNETANKASLTFSYNVSSSNSFKIEGATAATSGNYSAILEGGASLSISVQSKSGFSGTTATLTMQNFSLVAVSENSIVTFLYDSALGSVTAGGSAIANGATKEVSGTDGVSLAATVKSGASFLGWTDGTGRILSTATTYSLVPATDMTVKAAFAKDGGTPWFSVGNATQKSVGSGLLGMSKINYYEVGKSYLFDDLNIAANHAANTTTKALVLMNNATLPAGNYTIPSGVTLLIPFDKVNTLYTTQAQSVEAVKLEDYKTPTAYRTLNMASGANITINGAVSLSAKHHYANGSKVDGGSPAGALSFINMEENSSITVNNGGALYVYGFITGSGAVIANSGANVYENFQIMDFRGGTQSTDMKNGVFPISQYYLQNIEVPLTLYSGATEHAYTTVYMSYSDFGSEVAFISNKDAMFNLSNGYVVKDYDENTDRLVVKAYGDVTVSGIKMDIGTSDIDSSEFELPINGNMTVEIVTGNIVINQDVAFLPGSEIIIGKDAKCTLGAGNSMYVYDADKWGNYVGVGDSYGKFKAVTYAPGRKYTRTGADIVDAKVVVYGTVDATQGYIYTANGDANIVCYGTVQSTEGTQTITHQFDQGTAKYSEIPLKPLSIKIEGDVNSDSVVDNNDYTYIADVYTGKIKVDNVAEVCDMNGDGKFDIRDIIAINELINA